MLDNNRDSIMIFGAGELQESIIKTSKNMGLIAVVIDPNPDAMAKPISDYFYCVDGNDYEGTLSIAKKHKIKGLVTSATDKPLMMMARVADKLELPFPSVNSVKNTIDKYQFKKILIENHLPCADGYLINSNIDAIRLLNNNLLRFPVIIKPIDNSGSRGVIKCDSISDLENFISETFKETKANQILIEEYLEGDEISVEGVVQDGRVHIIQITDKLTTEFPYNVEIQHFQPSKYSNSHFTIIKDVLQTIVEILKLDNCAIHPEIKITGGSIKIVEIGPRLGGDYITSHLVPLSTGVNIEEVLINISIGKKINYEVHQRYSIIKYFIFEPGRIVHENIILNQIKNQIRQISSINIRLEKDQVIPKITNSIDRYGFVIIFGDSDSEVITIAHEVNNIVKGFILT